jgi:hypothetical protein
MTSIKLTFDTKDDDYLVWQGQVVMSRSEEPYLRKLFERVSMELRPTRVLEIGFGLGISAGLIQEHLRPAEHSIVEIDSGIYADLVRFAQDRPGLVSHLGDWRNAPIPVPFDFVFYDPFAYSMEPEDDDQEAKLLLGLVGKAGVLCHPHFGDGPVRPLPGFRNVVLERLEVPDITMADGSLCDRAAVVLCYPAG